MTAHQRTTQPTSGYTSGNKALAQQKHWTKRGRAASVLNPDVAGRPRRSVLYKEIADALNISYRTVHTHIEHIYEKLHVRSRSQAIAKYLAP